MGFKGKGLQGRAEEVDGKGTGEEEDEEGKDAEEEEDEE